MKAFYKTEPYITCRFHRKFVTNVINDRFTTLQIALGIVLKKERVDLVFCSYDEVLWFKPSVAAAAVSNAESETSDKGRVSAID